MKKYIRVNGLENIRLISDHPDGSTFKGRRTKEVDTIIKVLPYFVDLNNKEDLVTVNYLKELKKLKALNQAPNIHLANIISSELTEEDFFPYVETEMINGPDLDKLLTFPNKIIFRVEEAIDLASQMADALAHCHMAMVKHGRINIDNIRLNSETGHYVLLNFGWLLLTEEQRKEEISKVRSVDFLAPEQWQGKLFFETDTYSAGLVLFKALTGNLPNHISAKGVESTENQEAPVLSIPQQIKTLRNENLPFTWSEAEKVEEMKLPEWLLNLISVCLEHDPAKRINNGIKFQEEIKLNQLNAVDLNQNKKEPVTKAVKPVSSKDVSMAAPLIRSDDDKELEIKRLKSLIIQKDGQLDVLKYQTADYNPDSNKLSISKPIFFTLLALIALFGVIATYAYFFREPEIRGAITTYTDEGALSGDSAESNLKADMYADSIPVIDTAELLRSMPPIPEEQPSARDEVEEPEKPRKKPVVEKPTSKPTAIIKSKPKVPASNQKAVTVRKPDINQEEKYDEPPVNRTPRFTLAVSKAYLYDDPDVKSRRPIYLSNTNESEFTATKDSNGFIYVVFFNTE